MKQVQRSGRRVGQRSRCRRSGGDWYEAGSAGAVGQGGDSGNEAGNAGEGGDAGDEAQVARAILAVLPVRLEPAVMLVAVPQVKAAKAMAAVRRVVVEMTTA